MCVCVCECSGQKQVGRRGLEEAVALKWVPLLEEEDKQVIKQEVTSLKAVGKRLAQMPLPHHIISHKDDYRVKTDDGLLYHVIVTGSACVTPVPASVCCLVIVFIVIT